MSSLPPPTYSSPSAEKEEEAISSGIDVYQSKPAPASALVNTILNFRQQDQPQPAPEDP